MQKFDLKKFLLRFVKDSSGQMAIIFALLLIPIVAFIGGGIDYSQQVSYNNKLQSTIDSVSLAVAKAIARDVKISDAAMQKIAFDLYSANIPSNDNVTLDTLIIIKDTKNNTLTINQTGVMQTSFMRLVGVDELSVGKETIIDISRSDVELALVLDMSGSMRGSRLNALKDAAKDLINTLIQDTTGLATMRIGFVPWSVGVNVTGFEPSKVLVGGVCSSSRKKNYQDKSARVSKMPKASYCPNTKMTPLSDNKTTLLNNIATWSASGGTHSDVGLAWGWGMLSHKWKAVWPTKSQPKIYGDNVKKFIVLMSDGGNNHSSSDVYSKGLCKAMKKKDIKIYAIAFGTTVG
ncbi:MAG: TadE/TadG family protein, partial [Rhizobiales bacterium]|nr:TadE/TadG family protein [Hyphomicrobiales bacterium]